MPDTEYTIKMLFYDHWHVPTQVLSDFEVKFKTSEYHKAEKDNLKINETNLNIYLITIVKS